MRGIVGRASSSTSAVQQQNGDAASSDKREPSGVLNHIVVEEW